MTASSRSPVSTTARAVPSSGPTSLLHPAPSVSITPASSTASDHSRQRWIVAVAVLSSAVMEVLDTTVVNVSLPHIAGSLSASVEEATWVLTSYIVANAIILPISG